MLLIIASIFVGSYDYRKGKTEIGLSDFAIKGAQFHVSTVSNLEIDFNDNHGIAVYGERNYATGGKNFIRFINNKEAHEYEFFIPTNTEEQKLRKLVQSWAQPQS